MHTYDDDTWLCMPYVKWKQSRITCSIIVYDEVYNDIHEQCMAVKWLLGIHGLFDSDQSVDVISSSFRVWFDRFTGSTIFFLSRWQDGARKGGCSLLSVVAGELGSWSFLQVITYKLGGCSLLPVVARKLKSL